MHSRWLPGATDKTQSRSWSGRLSHRADVLYGKCMSARCCSRRLNKEHPANWNQAASGLKHQPEVAPATRKGCLRVSGRCVIHDSDGCSASGYRLRGLRGRFQRQSIPKNTGGKLAMNRSLPIYCVLAAHKDIIRSPRWHHQLQVAVAMATEVQSGRSLPWSPLTRKLKGPGFQIKR